MNNPGITLSKSGLFSKVSLLLTISLGISALGTYMGQGITSTGAIIALAVLFIFGSFGVRLAAKASTGAGIAALSVWTFVSGLFIGPAIHHYVQSIGLNTVLLVYIGSAGVMSACGAIGALSGINFSRMGRFLMFALLGLIVVGIVSIFVPMSTGVNIAYCLIGMTVFALFFVFDFFRLANSEDTWDAAFDLTMNIYLDYVNFVLYALRFAEIFLGGKSSKD